MKVSRSMSVLTGFMLLTLLVAAPVANAQSNEELLKRVQQLEEQVRLLLDARQDMTVTTVATTAPPVTATTSKPAKQPEGLGFDVGTTRVGYGGFIKLDTIFSSYSGGDGATSSTGEDFLVASTIPVGGKKSGVNFHASGKASRFYFTTLTPTENGHVNTRFEMDFYGSVQGNEVVSNSYSSRLRHAYVNWQVNDEAAILAGQSWSTFQNTDVLPETLDFIGTIGTVFNRQSQIRYTHKIGAGSVQLSAENPSTTLYSGADITGGIFDDNSIPDFVARYNGKSGKLSYSVAGIFRELVSDVDGMDGSEFGGALSFAARYTFRQDDIRFMASAGNALGRYLGVGAFNDGQIEADGNIELIPSYGGLIAYRHHWNNQLRSSLVVSAIAADNPGSVAATTARAYQSLHMNLIYQPLPGLTWGGEYIWARRQDEGVHGAELDDEGNLNRVQASMKYVF